MVQLLLQAVSRIRTRNSINDSDNEAMLNLSRVIKHDLIFDVNTFKRPKEVLSSIYRNRLLEFFQIK